MYLNASATVKLLIGCFIALLTALLDSSPADQGTAAFALGQRLGREINDVKTGEYEQ